MAYLLADLIMLNYTKLTRFLALMKERFEISHKTKRISFLVPNKNFLYYKACHSIHHPTNSRSTLQASEHWKEGEERNTNKNVKESKEECKR